MMTLATLTVVSTVAAAGHGSIVPGLIVGGVLVVLGFAGGVYGQMLRRRGRRQL